jgi:hypothetical protein
MSDSPQNGSYIVQNKPLGASEQGRTYVGREKEPLGFPTGLARLHHVRRVMGTRESCYLRTQPSLKPAAIFEFFLPLLHQNLSVFSIFKHFVSMASSSGGPDSLVVFRFHDFRAERMRHWWTLLGGNDHASIKSIFGKFSSLIRLRVDCGLLKALALFWDPTHCCFSIGEMDLVPTLEEYIELLQLGSPFDDTPFVPSPSLWSNRALGKCLGLTFEVLRQDIHRVDDTWRKAIISLDLLMKYFSWTDFPVDLAGDFSAGSQGWGQLRINAFKIAFAGIFLFPTSAGRIDVGVVPLVYGEDESIVPVVLCETVRSLSYCRRRGEGIPMFCV